MNHNLPISTHSHLVAPLQILFQHLKTKMYVSMRAMDPEQETAQQNIINYQNNLSPSLILYLKFYSASSYIGVYYAYSREPHERSCTGQMLYGDSQLIPVLILCVPYTTQGAQHLKLSYLLTHSNYYCHLWNITCFYDLRLESATVCVSPFTLRKQSSGWLLAEQKSK